MKAFVTSDGKVVINPDNVMYMEYGTHPVITGGVYTECVVYFVDGSSLILTEKDGKRLRHYIGGNV